MKRCYCPAFICALVLSALSLRGADPLDAALQQATLDYSARLKKAGEELNQTRKRIADEKAPLLNAARAAEDRIIAAESEIYQLDTAQEHSQETRRALVRAAEALRKNLSYLNSFAQDSLKVIGDGLAPGESQFLETRLRSLQKRFDDPSAALQPALSLEVAALLREHLEHSLGGYAAQGLALVGEGNEVVEGTYAFFGPGTFFRASKDGRAGTVRKREGSPYPIVTLLEDWKSAESSTAFFKGDAGLAPLDASGGKALKLAETKGTLWEHIRKGGTIAFAILAVGLISLVMIIVKVGDLWALRLDAPEVVYAFLERVSAGKISEARGTLNTFTKNFQELATVGLRSLEQPKSALEERLYAVLLRQRLHYERLLPLLAVIATAAPLMGLLGTVTGMVKTFALITVFGTGNAGKLSSGISEVLVATELGLMVAIPTLVAHGFLMHRIQKNLSLLEKYALEFETAAEASRIKAEGEEPVRA